MDMYKLKFTRLQSEIFRLLCIKARESLNQRRLSQLLGVSPTAIAKALPLLEKEGMISKEAKKPMNLTLVELNRDSQKVMQLKRCENLRMIYESGLIEFLTDSFPGSTIILFGSYSRGEDTTSSDIDIAIIGRKEKMINLDGLEKLLERKININFYDSMKDIHKNLRENICNGIVLSGGIEL